MPTLDNEALLERGGYILADDGWWEKSWDGPSGRRITMRAFTAPPDGPADGAKLWVFEMLVDDIVCFDGVGPLRSVIDLARVRLRGELAERKRRAATIP